MILFKVPCILNTENSRDMDLRNTYMLVILMNGHKDGHCTFEDVLLAARMVDSNRSRAKKRAEKFLGDETCVRGIGEDRVYLSSLQKRFVYNLCGMDEKYLNNYKAFRNELIARTALYHVEISHETLAKIFHMEKRQIKRIINKLIENGRIDKTHRFVRFNMEKNNFVPSWHSTDPDKRNVQLPNRYDSVHQTDCGHSRRAETRSNSEKPFVIEKTGTCVVYDGSKLFEELYDKSVYPCPDIGVFYAMTKDPEGMKRINDTLYARKSRNRKRRK